MSVTADAARDVDPYHIGHNQVAGLRQPQTEHAGRDDASLRIIVGYGFWIFLLSDIILFSAFFAAYAVLSDATAGGPGGRDLFNLNTVAIETACLLFSSFSCGVANIGARLRSNAIFIGGMVVTALLGGLFLILEVREFARMIAAGAGPSRSAFASSFFALVGCHGIHVSIGLIWLVAMIGLVLVKGFREDIQRRLLCFGLFWHTLDIIWVGIFTTVYLLAFTP